MLADETNCGIWFSRIQEIIFEECHQQVVGRKRVSRGQKTEPNH